MADKSQPQQDQSNSAPGASEVQYKKCNDCCALLPIAQFTLNYLGKKGRNNVCKDCRAQDFRLLRKRKYNSKSKVDDSIVRNMAVHNTTILKEIIPSNTNHDIYGFKPNTSHIYRIHIGRSRYDMMSIAIFDQSGNVYREYAWSGDPDDVVIATILAILKEHSIRLERSEGDMVLAKRTIYYL